MTMMVTGGGNDHDEEAAVAMAMNKVFVGGLAWETPKEAMRDHFHQYGDIVEAVIISDKLTGRSKGYGFVTFKDPEAAKKACQDPSPIINGRRANCNLAALRARRAPNPNTTTTPPQQGKGVNVGSRAVVSTTTPHHTQQVQWYYHYPASGGGATPPLPYHHHHQAVPYYSYSPAAYIAPPPSDMINYNHNTKVGGYSMNGQYNTSSQVYHHPHHHQMSSHHIPNYSIPIANTMLQPFYPFYHHHYSHSQSHHQAMGLPAHLYSPLPPLIPTPTASIHLQPHTPTPTPTPTPGAAAAAVGQHS